MGVLVCAHKKKLGKAKLVVDSASGSPKLQELVLGLLKPFFKLLPKLKLLCVPIFSLWPPNVKRTSLVIDPVGGVNESVSRIGETTFEQLNQLTVVPDWISMTHLSPLLVILHFINI